MTPAVVILSAGSSKEKMPGVPVFKTSPAFLPINSRSLGKLVIDFYLSENIQKVYLVINDTDYQAATEEFGCFGDSIQILSVSDSHSVVDTIEKILPRVSENDLIFNIVTTLPKVVIATKNCIGINETTTGIEGWAGVKLQGSGPSTEMTFITKKESFGQVGYSFSGIFRADKADIATAIKTVQGDARKDLISIISNIHKVKPMSLVHYSWSDCGHPQNYFKTRASIFGSRFFNSISLDTENGILTKSSSNKLKLQREVDYVNALPEDLMVFFPRILKVQDDGAKAKLQMEYYAYPTIAEIMLYWDLPVSSWTDIFSKLSFTLNKFSSHKGQLKSGDWFEMYVTKVRERIEAFKKQLSDEELKRLFTEKEILINDKTYNSWATIDQDLEAVCKLIEKSEDCTVIHGDYCFNNILCEPYVGLIKLLDARGSFGEQLVGIYGDRKYDWAKLGHSVVGRYDYIVNDLFKADFTGNGFTLRTFDRPWQTKLDELFWLSFNQTKLDSGLIKFIIGTLFISMPPLHAENRKRQTAFFLKGIEFLNHGLAELGLHKNA